MIHKPSRCDFCGTCVGVCPQDAIELAECELVILCDRCTMCRLCIHICPLRALELSDETRI
ncbi:4Fe-4S binding protein [candidate division KSB1 bacterium]|nr:4Fe-4S binding protein [candidate division KSB1 bacterium]